MKRMLIILVAGVLLVLMTAALCHANAIFIATAKNFRGALYQGVGPTPVHASEAAVIKCSQDSFVPPSCRVVSVRMECPPPLCPPRKVVRKAQVSKVYPAPYSMGGPMGSQGH
jgi:hypothetical protein